MWINAKFVGSGILALGMVMAGSAQANAGDRPVNVAFVQAWHFDVLHHGGVTMKGAARCKPGWESAEIDMRATQGDSYGDAFTTAAVACDNHWHAVTVRITDFFGTLRPGAIHVSSQILVTNVDSGDSAGGHDERAACLRRPGGSC